MKRTHAFRRKMATAMVATMLVLMALFAATMTVSNNAAMTNEQFAMASATLNDQATIDSGQMLVNSATQTAKQTAQESAITNPKDDARAIDSGQFNLNAMASSSKNPLSAVNKVMVARTIMPG